MLLVGAAGALLAIASLNVGCLLLARVLDRRRELAIRAALGAGRARLAGQLLAESLLVSAAGALLGIVIGPAVLKAVLAVSPVALPSYVSVSPDLRVTLAALAALVVAAVVAGTVPAFVGSTSGVSTSASLGSRGTVSAPGEKRWVTVLIASETALTLVLLVCGTLMLRSYDRLASLDLGFRRQGIARLAVTLSPEDGGPPTAREGVYDRLRRAVAAVPGVKSVGFVTPTLPPWDADRTRVRFDGLDPRSAEQGVAAGLHVVDEGLLPTLGIRIVAGRNFAGREPAATAIVSRGLADRMGGVESAIGRTIDLPDDPAMMSELAVTFTIVGVAENVAWDGLVEQDTRRMIHYASAADPRAGRWDVYVSLARLPQTIVSIAAATDGSAEGLVEPVRRAIAAVTPTSAVHWAGVMDDEIALEYAPTRFYGVVIALFSASAMLLTGAGLLALLWHASVRRTGEMGLRFALGATRTRVALLIVRAGIAPVLAGVLTGLLGALWAADAIKALLYDVPPFDPIAFAAAFALLAGIAALAAWLPARRAAAVSPLVALRSE
jgi:predicted permease